MFKMIEENTQTTVADLPAAIEATAVAVHAAAKTVEQRRELVALRACEIKTDILTARNEAGKPIYSNDAARDCAATDALASDENYQELVEELDDAERLKIALSAKLERLRAEYRIAIIDYEADRLGRRAA